MKKKFLFSFLFFLFLAFSIKAESTTVYSYEYIQKKANDIVTVATSVFSNPFDTITVKTILTDYENITAIAIVNNGTIMKLTEHIQEGQTEATIDYVFTADILKLVINKNALY
jgi:hypothetical protein